jgi:hypothetical protein
MFKIDFMGRVLLGVAGNWLNEYHCSCVFPSHPTHHGLQLLTFCDLVHCIIIFGLPCL